MSRTDTDFDFYATLDEHKNVVPCTHEEFVAWRCFDIDNRRVAEWRCRDVYVSTVFLGMNHGFGTEPLWFESMVFGGEMDDEQRRYSTWAEAVAGHNELVAEVEATMRTRMITFED
jgi:hypothetical protein